MIANLVAHFQQWRKRRALDSAKRSLKYAGIPLRDPALVAIFGRNEVTSGVDVNEDTALNFSAVFSAVNLISSTVALIPIKLAQRDPKSDKTDPVIERHVANQLFAVGPNDYTTPFVFRQTHQAHALTHGNAYIEIIRKAGVPVALRTLLPDQVNPKWDKDGNYVYELHEYQNGGGSKAREILPQNMIHVPGLGYDGTKGYSVISRAREGIGLGVATEQYGASFFGRGAIPGGVITHPGELSPEAEKNLATDWQRKHKNVSAGHNVAVLDEGMKYTQIGIPPEDSQFLETRKFQVVEIARWFRVPPHMLYEAIAATFANMEQQNLDFLTYTLMPWLVRWEQELTRKLLTVAEQERYCFVHDPSILLRPDASTRFQIYATARNNSIYTLNDIMRREHLPLLPADIGDTRIAPSTMRTLGSNDPTAPVDMTVVAAALALIQQLGNVSLEDAHNILTAAVPSAPDQFITSITTTLAKSGRVVTK